MADEQHHRIFSIGVDVNVPEGEDHTNIQQRISRISRTDLLREMEALFSRTLPPDEMFSLERLEIDLGDIEITRLEELWVPRIIESLRDALRKQSHRFRSSPYAAGSRTGKGMSRGQVELLLYFLRSGGLPWWYNEELAFSPGELLRKLVREDARAALGMLQEVAQNEAALRRVAQLLNEEEWTELVKARWGGGQEALIRMLKASMDLEIRDVEQEAVRLRIMEALLGAVVRSAGNAMTLQERNSWLVGIFAEVLKRSGKQAGNAAYLDELGSVWEKSGDMKPAAFRNWRDQVEAGIPGTGPQKETKVKAGQQPVQPGHSNEEIRFLEQWRTHLQAEASPSQAWLKTVTQFSGWSRKQLRRVLLHLLRRPESRREWAMTASSEAMEDIFRLISPAHARLLILLRRRLPTLTYPSPIREEDTETAIHAAFQAVFERLARPDGLSWSPRVMLPVVLRQLAGAFSISPDHLRAIIHKDPELQWISRVLGPDRSMETAPVASLVDHAPSRLPTLPPDQKEGEKGEKEEEGEEERTEEPGLVELSGNEDIGPDHPALPESQVDEGELSPADLPRLQESPAAEAEKALLEWGREPATAEELRNRRYELGIYLLSGMLFPGATVENLLDHLRRLQEMWPEGLRVLLAEQLRKPEAVHRLAELYPYQRLAELVLLFHPPEFLLFRELLRELGAALRSAARLPELNLSPARINLAVAEALLGRLPGEALLLDDPRTTWRVILRETAQGFSMTEEQLHRVIRAGMTEKQHFPLLRSLLAGWRQDGGQVPSSDLGEMKEEGTDSGLLSPELDPELDEKGEEIVVQLPEWMEELELVLDWMDLAGGREPVPEEIDGRTARRKSWAAIVLEVAEQKLTWPELVVELLKREARTRGQTYTGLLKGLLPVVRALGSFVNDPLRWEDMNLLIERILDSLDSSSEQSDYGQTISADPSGGPGGEERQGSGPGEKTQTPEEQSTSIGSDLGEEFPVSQLDPPLGPDLPGKKHPPQTPLTDAEEPDHQIPSEEGQEDPPVRDEKAASGPDEASDPESRPFVGPETGFSGEEERRTAGPGEELLPEDEENEGLSEEPPTTAEEGKNAPGLLPPSTEKPKAEKKPAELPDPEAGTPEMVHEDPGIEQTESLSITEREIPAFPPDPDTPQAGTESHPPEVPAPEDGPDYQRPLVQPVPEQRDQAPDPEPIPPRTEEKDGSRDARDQRYRKAWEDEVRREAADLIFSIQNAGLVLIWPYLGHYFKMLGLTGEDGFVSEAARERAVYLLQYAATGDPGAEEYQLVLNKVLCGIPVGVPLFLPGIAVTGKEAEITDQMLRAAIAHWHTIGETSIAGLRESFLKRPGTLEVRPGAYRLQVEPRAYDLLLQTLPWSISMVQLSWMEQVLEVEWK